MEDWVLRGLARWPNVPALFGWLSLDGRGRWRIKGELISRPQIIDTLNRNYAADEQGRWYFQNGPQRGYVDLETAPLLLRATPDDAVLVTHNGLRVLQPTAAYLDEQGALWLATEHGPALLNGADLDWALSRIASTQGAFDDVQLAAALALPSGAETMLSLGYGDLRLRLQRLDDAQAPAALGFVRQPQPVSGEKASR